MMKFRRVFFSSRISRVSIFISILILLSTYIMLSRYDRFMLFLISRNTGCSVDCVSWVGNPLAKSLVRGVTVEKKGIGYSIKADNILLEMKSIRGLFDVNKKLNIKISASSVSLVPENKTYIPGDGEDLGNDKNMGLMGNDFLQKEIILDNLHMSYERKGSVYRISDLYCTSKDIVIRGRLELNEKTLNSDIEIYIYLSPDFLADIPGGVKEGLFTLNEKGWYVTVINYKGNILFLKAIYSFF